MAFRSEITVLWKYSPRIIVVDTTLVNISIQDLYDTLRFLEERPSEGLPYPSIVSAGGKEDLGGGDAVGVTLTLLNAILYFDQDVNTLASGTITAHAPEVVTDSAATFLSDGIEPGDILENTTDGSFAAIREIIDDITVDHFPISGGATNVWQVGDSYKIFDVVPRRVFGGNLVAVDDVEAALNPIMPSPLTQVTVERSSSPTIAGGNVADDVWAANPDDNNEPNTMGRVVRGPQR